METTNDTAPAPRCSVGACDELATRRLEITRCGDELPAEVRPLCDDRLCEKLARSSAAGFGRNIVAMVPGA